jgi:broad specificity phosphatase PhoE
LKITFVRHGESSANTLHVFSNHKADHPLTEKGKAQAEALANLFLGQKFSAFFSSPIPRAVETAQIISDRIHMPFMIHEGLKEFDAGVLEGRSDENAWTEFSALWKDWFTGGLNEKKIEGGESLLEIRDRLGAFLVEVKRQYPENDASILCITHGGLLYAAIPGIVDNVPYAFIQEHLLGNTESIMIDWNGKNWKCLQWAATVFMD